MRFVGGIIITFWCLGLTFASELPTNSVSAPMSSGFYSQLDDSGEPDDDFWREIDPNGDAWPWPWGTECPFPWFMIGGVWQIEAKTTEGYFGFKGITKTTDSGHSFTILRYNKFKELISYGRGVAENGTRIISVLMHSVGASHSGAYSAHFRAYRKKDQNGCNKDEMVTAVTVVPFIGENDMDLNFTIEKAVSSEGFPGMEEEGTLPDRGRGH